jgi:hypothetical protein
MKITTLLSGAVLGVFCAGALLPGVSHGQSGADSVSNEVLASHVTQLEQNQGQIASNDQKIQELIASATEEVRLCKIYVSRGGGAPKKVK